METKKHFIAIHNETGERIEFGIEDIMEVARQGIHIWDSKRMFPRKVCQLFTEVEMIEDWLSDHTLYYLHQGKYYNYETQEEIG